MTGKTCEVIALLRRSLGWGSVEGCNFLAHGASIYQSTIMTSKAAFGSSLVVLSVAAWMLARGSDSVSEVKGRTPVLVELFTSEGCSSCPPADRFLEKLDRQPVAGAEMIVLSEHVDYWNHIGWKDPYSAHVYSERQALYGKRFGLDSVYTPQMVVDGSSEFVGSNPALADEAFAKALSVPKISVHLSLLSADPSVVDVHLETGALEPSFGAREAEVQIAVALSRAESQVSSGENAGHRLAHVSVVRSLTKVGVLKRGQGLSQDVHLNLGPAPEFHNLRLVAFVQEPRQGRVLGAALLPVSAN